MASHSCIACKHSLQQGASICSVCSSYQRSWKNHLQYISTIAGILTISLSAVFYIAKSTVALFLYVHPKDQIIVLGASTTGDIVLVNAGNRRMLVSRVHFLVDVPEVRHTRSEPIQEVIEPGKVLHYDPWKKRGIPVSLPSGGYISGKTSDEWSAILKRIAQRDPCLVMHVMSVTDPELLRLRDFLGDELNSVGAVGYVEFRPDITGAVQRERFEASGVVLAVNSEECKQ